MFIYLMREMRKIAFMLYLEVCVGRVGVNFLYMA